MKRLNVFGDIQILNDSVCAQYDAVTLHIKHFQRVFFWENDQNSPQRAEKKIQKSEHSCNPH